MSKVNLNQLKKSVTNMKNYTDSKTKAIPEKYDAYILNNAVPESSVTGEVYGDQATLYKISDSDIVFPENSILTNEDLKYKLSSINKLSETQKCIITYNDGAQDITKNIELERGSYYSDTNDGLIIMLREEYPDENGESKFGLFVIAAVEDDSSSPQSDERLMRPTCKYLEVKNITLYIELYKNQLPDKAIVDLNFDKITNLPYDIENLKNNEADVLTREEKILLIKNRSLWGSENIDDYNKAPYTTSAPNNTFRNVNNINQGITVKAKKPALGKGLKIEPFYYVYTYYLYYRKSPNVVIDIVNSKGTIIHSLDSNEDADTLQFYYLSANTFDKNNDCYFVFSLKEDAPADGVYGVYQFHLINMGDSILTYADIDKKFDKKEISKYASISYVDEKAVNNYAQLKDRPIEILPYTEKLNTITNTTQKICAVNAADLKANTTYMCPDNCGRLGIKYTKLDNTEIAFFLSYNTNNLIIQTGYKDDKKIEILIDGIVYTVTFKTATEEPKVEKTVRYLTDKNTIEFTPTKDYQPSTKKYVDDTVVFKKLSSIIELNGTKKIINVEKFEDNKVYYFINDINTSTTTLVSISLYKNNEKVNTMVIYPNDRFITMGYKSSTNEFFSFSDMESVKYNVVNKTREYNNSRSVTKKADADQVLTKTNTTEYTPTSDYHPTTKKYVDDKTSMENVIYEGNGTGPDAISDYWTGCPVSSGNGCWVINKQIEFDSSKPNPYYLLCDNTLYSPENSTFDATNSAWIYPKVPNTGTIFICNKYNNENKLVLPWDGANSPLKMKLYTKTELASAISDGDLEATSDEVKTMLANVLGGDYSAKKN